MLTTPADTEEAARALEAAGADLILFAGGDGTARDIYHAIGDRVPVIGVPAGVKIHSAVYATTPAAAGDVVALALHDRPAAVHLRECEVMDIDEDAFREDRVSAHLYGYMKVPVARGLVQSAKAGGVAGEQSVLARRRHGRDPAHDAGRAADRRPGDDDADDPRPARAAVDAARRGRRRRRRRSSPPTRPRPTCSRSSSVTRGRASSSPSSAARGTSSGAATSRSAPPSSAASAASASSSSPRRPSCSRSKAARCSSTPATRSSTPSSAATSRSRPASANGRCTGSASDDAEARPSRVRRRSRRLVRPSVVRPVHISNVPGDRRSQRAARPAPRTNPLHIGRYRRGRVTGAAAAPSPRPRPTRRP